MLLSSFSCLALEPVFYREILLPLWMPHNGRLREQHIHTIAIDIPHARIYTCLTEASFSEPFCFPLLGGISLVEQRKAVNAAAHISSREAHGSHAAAQPDPPPTRTLLHRALEHDRPRMRFSCVPRWQCPIAFCVFLVSLILAVFLSTIYLALDV